MNNKQHDPWIPSNALEEEVISLQPNCDFIFGNYMNQEPFYATPQRPKPHLELVDKLRKSEEQQKQLMAPLCPDQREKLSTIIKVQNIIHTKPLGEMPSVDDWNDGQQSERDTIAMMRRLHLGPSTDTPLNSACTIGTVTSPEDYKIVKTRNGQFPVFLGENFFKLSPATSENDENSVLLKSNSSEGIKAEEVADLINLSTTESSWNSSSGDSREISYQTLSTSSSCNYSFGSERDYYSAQKGSYPLNSFIRTTVPKNKKNRNKNKK